MSTSLPVPVSIEALDNRGGVSPPQQFQLSIASATSGSAPTIGTTALPGPAVVNSPWQYQFLASDDDGDKLTYSLDSTSTAAGLSIDPNTGLMTWTPTGVVTLSPVVTITDDRNNTAVSPTYSLQAVTSQRHQCAEVHQQSADRPRCGRAAVYLSGRGR